MALAALFAARGCTVTLWAPSDHPGNLDEIKTNKDKIAASTAVEGEFQITTTYGLEEAIKASPLIIVVTVADAHESYVDALAKYNEQLRDKYLFVMHGQAFTMRFSKRLTCRSILESSNFAGAVKRTAPAKVDIKKTKDAMGVSSFPVLYDPAGHQILPHYIKWAFNQLFPGMVLEPVKPLAMALSSNYITHAITAAMNMGRLPEDQEKLNDTEKKQIAELAPRMPPQHPWFFYGQGMSQWVCYAQDAVDEERLRVAMACGVPMKPILDECNEEYGTQHQTIRAFSTAPAPHNVQYAAPTGIGHRYFGEEVAAMKTLIAIAEVFGVGVPLTRSFVTIIEAVKQKAGIAPFPNNRFEAFKKMSAEDFNSFGADIKELPTRAV